MCLLTVIICIALIFIAYYVFVCGEDVAVYTKAIIAKPSEMGMICPNNAYASRQIAQTFISQNKFSENDIVVEFGPGLGKVTQQLLAGGLREQQLVLVELNRDLSERLRYKFPKATVVCGNAHSSKFINIQQMRPLVGHVAAVISTMPISTFSPSQTQKLLRNIKALLAKSDSFLQVSYGNLKLLRAKKIKTIWFNLPPLSLWKIKVSSSMRVDI